MIISTDAENWWQRSTSVHNRKGKAEQDEVKREVCYKEDLFLKSINKPHLMVKYRQLSL